ncbi:hypothetical protein HYPSUDRAFT_441704 [Hypholoma sublateritium FD-334 SS-4]|uniref:Uncharacterized protein n=1 Tax=Hypholoma sublateritium (strain FD-334 SS-4) TaxID=945553 RepID=A0A0D2P9I6_HYPSF|nr:hypothetical protein HYPSUDRAFT_441704 [Hypholoma sublateritium FD-334 SS-4]
MQMENSCYRWINSYRITPISDNTWAQYAAWVRYAVHGQMQLFHSPNHPASFDHLISCMNMVAALSSWEIAELSASDT